MGGNRIAKPSARDIGRMADAFSFAGGRPGGRAGGSLAEPPGTRGPPSPAGLGGRAPRLQVLRTIIPPTIWYRHDRTGYMTV